MQPKTFIPPHAVAGILNVWLPTWVDGMCEGCATKAKQVYDETRSECWEKLPSYFGLPEWKELKRMDFE
ncbi:BTB domain-containing protein [Mycena chlorophos]|uniref:BTB domain-containing protein n=1 Tax=Mycena chlorophos TaxID=658473 RepID=A0A8H6VZY3_MYCCL|nr:BTB domain-containing protein [Mycena chlorophos]